MKKERTEIIGIENEGTLEWEISRRNREVREDGTVKRGRTGTICIEKKGILEWLISRMNREVREDGTVKKERTGMVRIEQRHQEWKMGCWSFEGEKVVHRKGL